MTQWHDRTHDPATWPYHLTTVTGAPRTQRRYVTSSSLDRPWVHWAVHRVPRGCDHMTVTCQHCLLALRWFVKFFPDPMVLWSWDLVDFTTDSHPPNTRKRGSEEEVPLRRRTITTWVRSRLDRLRHLVSLLSQRCLSSVNDTVDTEVASGVTREILS